MLHDFFALEQSRRILDALWNAVTNAHAATICLDYRGSVKPDFLWVRLTHCFLTFLQDSGMPPVDMVRDPRIGRLWTKYKETDLPVPQFKVVTPPHWSLHRLCTRGLSVHKSWMCAGCSYIFSLAIYLSKHSLHIYLNGCWVGYRH